MRGHKHRRSCGLSWPRLLLLMAARSGAAPSSLSPGVLLPLCPPLRSGQVRLLSSMLARSDLPEELVQRCSLAVSTVDGYQGREADAVIFSAVRW